MSISHEIKIVELGLDIRSLDQIAHYPIIIFDVNEAAKAGLSKRGLSKRGLSKRLTATKGQHELDVPTFSICNIS
jgi:hypothetical protein